MLTDPAALIGPCATEDANDCYWNAPTMGNGTGTSFVDLAGVTYPIDGCAPGEGLPAVDIDADGIPWAYCERALGNDSPGESAPIEGPTDTVYVPETGEIVHETTGEVIETVAVPVTDDTPELAVTGPDDVSPLTVIVGALLMVVGVTLARRARRA